MLNEISEVHRSILQGAAAREDRLLQPPAKARGAVVKTIAGKLIDAGWAREIGAPSGAPVWREDAVSGDVLTLKLTAKGLKAIAAAGGGAGGAGKSSAPAAAEKVPPKSSTRRSMPAVPAQLVTAAGGPSDAASPTAARAPRAGSKLADVLARLSAQNGATISELMTTTNWLEHSTRAALTGLRHRGYAFSLTPREREGASVYRVAAGGGEPAK